jgi:hypothetical protein
LEALIALMMAVQTNCVVAIEVLHTPVAGVGAVGFPVNTGLFDEMKQAAPAAQTAPVNAVQNGEERFGAVRAEISVHGSTASKQLPALNSPIVA